MRLGRLLVALTLSCALFAALAGSASATIFQYNSYFDLTGADNATPGGNVSVRNLDSTKTTRLVITPPTGAPYDQTHPSGTDYFDTLFVPGLPPGSTIQVRQPSASVTPTETYVIPAPTISLATGGTSISGAVPAGLSGAVNGDYRCDLNYQPQAVGAGAFSVPYPKILPGEWVQLILHDAVGNITALGTSTPGETPCVSLTGTGSTLPPPGSPPPPGDYSINVGHLLASGGASVRVVIRRGTSAYFDESVDNMYLNGAVTTRPSPGDVVDIYRPKTAPAPTYSIAVPNVSAKFDAAADLVAVDTPAGGDIRAYACRAYGCNNENSRGLRGLVAGRQLLNFHVAEGVYVPVDIHPTDIVNVYFHDVDFTIEYGFQATPGDLVAPIQSFKLPSKLKVSALLKALKKGYKVKLTSNEVGTAKLSLGKFAKVTKSVKPGSNTITLKFSKSGKKAIKKLAAKGKKAKPLSVSLTSVVTDASGNASTLVKKTKIKR